MQHGIHDLGMYAATTPDELRKRLAMKKVRNAVDESREQKQARLDRENRYAREVTRPVARMRKAGVAKEEIRAFQAKHVAMIKEERGPTMTKNEQGISNWYHFDTHTVRTEAERMEDHKPGLKTYDITGTKRKYTYNPQGPMPWRRQKLEVNSLIVVGNEGSVSDMQVSIQHWAGDTKLVDDKSTDDIMRKEYVTFS